MTTIQLLNRAVVATYLVACSPAWGADTSAQAEQLLMKVITRTHPRTLASEQIKAIKLPSVLSTSKSQTAVALLPIQEPVSEYVGSESLTRLSIRDSMRIQGVVSQEEVRILTLALIGLRDDDNAALGAAKAKAVSMARWSKTGATSFLVNDQAGRMAAVALAVAYDWLYAHLDGRERAEILGALKHRVSELISNAFPYGLDHGRKLDRSPLDSHAISTLASVAVVCTAMAGHDPVFTECFKDIVPRYVNRPIPWGGNDGGFANGTAYAHWATLGSHFFAWDLLKNALDINLWQTPWAIGYGRYMAYFLPPGAPAGVFGDETEKRLPDIWATQARIYATYAPSPLADWYARNQAGGDTEHLPTLLLPFRDWSQGPSRPPQNTPNAAYFADIGWVAMHSDLADRARTSVYFKSSPYGSGSHSHADQNSFAIHARGQSLAIDSGYYDFYGSPHWKDWYKQTLAHNAITFDNGKGQLHDSFAAKGRIARFEHHGDYDIVTGDAKDAYGGALTQATRTLVFLRPNTLLVFDALASSVARTWEWNIHASLKMKELGARMLEIDACGARLCVNMLSAPQGAFAHTNQFTSDPQGTYPSQWHARYSTSVRLGQARFVSMLSVGCTTPQATAHDAGDSFVVDVAGRRFTFSKDGGVVAGP